MKNPHTLIISLILIIIFVALGSSVSFSQDKSIEELYYQGVDLLENKKQYKEALTYFQQIIELNPGHAEAHFQIGKIFRNTTQFEKAITYHKNAINLRPNYSSAYYELGLAYLELQKKKEALEAFKQAIRSKPDFANAHYGLGWAYSQLKDYEKAIESFKQVIRIQPDYTFAHYVHYSLGMIYLVQGDKNAALDEYKILKDLDQDIADQLFDMIYK